MCNQHAAEPTTRAFVPRGRTDFKMRDGLAVVQQKGPRRILWVDCKTCGHPTPPAVHDTRLKYSSDFWGKSTSTEVLEMLDLVEVRGDKAYNTNQDWARCSACNEVGMLRTVTDRHADGAGKRSKCTGPCINGKTSCDCKCQGRCHGAGTCYC